MHAPGKPLALPIAALALLSLGASCDRVAEPGLPETPSTATPPSATEAPRSDWTGLANGETQATPVEPRHTVTLGKAPCVVPLRERPPPVVQPARDCPKDPEGAPVMPQGHVTFEGAPSAPTIPVELAVRPDHREHGLMFRTDLGADAGMLFSWNDVEQRTFWMHNTCLPLDMLFIDRDGTIVGILEQVPPMNDDPRSVPCEAAHVLEVHAGWSRKHGVVPGQKVRIDAAR